MSYLKTPLGRLVPQQLENKSFIPNAMGTGADFRVLRMLVYFMLLRLVRYKEKRGLSIMACLFREDVFVRKKMKLD